MTRLIVLVEGQTEESFVNNVLSTHLYSVGYTSVRAHLLGNARQRTQSGGIKPWGLTQQDILDHLLQDQGAVVTTMVDYYGLPESWPGRADAGMGRTLGDKSAAVEGAVLDQITGSIENFNPGRFIPYVVMHEFEALLFSAPDRFAESIGEPELASQFLSIVQEFMTPEHIDDAPETHPSQRILNLLTGYRKPRMGLLAVQSIGLDTIRRECPMFGQWIERLEQVVQT